MKCNADKPPTFRCLECRELVREEAETFTRWMRHGAKRIRVRFGQCSRCSVTTKKTTTQPEPELVRLPKNSREDQECLCTCKCCGEETWNAVWLLHKGEKADHSSCHPYGPACSRRILAYQKAVKAVKATGGTA